MTRPPPSARADGAAPAFAQSLAIDEGNDVQYNAGAQNIIGSVGAVDQTQVGTATATAEDDSAAAASVDQAQDVSISQSNVFGNGFCVSQDTDRAGVPASLGHRSFSLPST